MFVIHNKFAKEKSEIRHMHTFYFGMYRRVLSAIMHKAFAQLLIARVRWVRRRVYRAQGSLDRQAYESIIYLEKRVLM